MGKIIAIGGGEIGRPGTKIETLSIDKEIIAQSGKEHPHVLFVPTASSDSQGYSQLFQQYYGKKLNCKVDTLFLTKNPSSKATISKKILNTDIIYVGGGNTLKMMMIWRRLGVDKILLEAYKKNIVLSGLSAGSICWFRHGNSDSRVFTSGSNKLIKVAGLNLIDALHCPHYDVEPLRKPDLEKMMKHTPGVAIALNNFTALEIIDYQYRILKSKKSAKAYKIYWKKNIYYKEEIPINNKFSDLNNLLQK